jgi:hypothetical protein
MPRVFPPRLFHFLLPMMGLLSACATPTERAARLAGRTGFQAEIVSGKPFLHQVFVKWTGGDSLSIFIEGDGSPWIRQGRTVSEDPTPRRALALELAARTPGSVLYLGRPCYFGARSDSTCEARRWTFDRYSAATVASMAAVANRLAEGHAVTHITLVGYSGGGTLALLMAPRVHAVERVITVAGNLDVEQWTRYHGYEALDGSLDPASQEPLGAAIEQWHLLGDRDLTVPPELVRRYLERAAPERVLHFPTFDHRCCWAQSWPRIWARIEGVAPISHP